MHRGVAALLTKTEPSEPAEPAEPVYIYVLRIARKYNPYVICLACRHLAKFAQKVLQS
jgi:hypothetical protein